MSAPRPHVLHVLATDASRSSVLTVDGGLPRVSTPVAAGGLVRAASDALCREWRLRGPLLELHEGDGEPQADGSFAVLVVPAPPASSWNPCRPACWSPLAAFDPVLPPSLRARCRQLLAEWRDGSPPPPLRPAWARPGWYERASAWMTDRLAEAGRPPSGPIEQFTHWELSAVMRVETAGGRAWFKAVFPLFAHEPAVTVLLDRELPGRVAPVIAVDPGEGWLVLDDVGSEAVADHPEADVPTIARLVECQRRFVDRVDEPSALGCPRRPLRDLGSDLAAALSDPIARAWLELSDERLETLVEWTRGAARDVDDLGYPDTLVHGDFHAMNAAVTDGGPVIFDWSDAAISNPLVDAMTWSTWLGKEPERAQQAWRAFFDGWADVCPPARVTARLDTLRGLAAGYHTVSYSRLLTGLEPLCRADLASGLQHYFRLLDEAVPW